MNAPDEFAADIERLVERIDWFQLSMRDGVPSSADVDELGRQMSVFVARWGHRLHDSEQVQALLRCAASIREAFALNEIAFRSDVLLALALRRDLLAQENLFAVERQMYRDAEALAPDERHRAEELLGRPERTLGMGFHAVETAEAYLETQLAKMRRDWAERADDDFARRVREADETAIDTWMLEVETARAQLKALASGGA